jgi:hypothetical protein
VIGRELKQVTFFVPLAQGERLFATPIYLYKGIFHFFLLYDPQEKLSFSQEGKTRDRGQETEEQRTGSRGTKDRSSRIEPQKREHWDGC